MKKLIPITVFLFFSVTVFGQANAHNADFSPPHLARVNKILQIRRFIDLKFPAMVFTFDEQLHDDKAAPKLAITSNAKANFDALAKIIIDYMRADSGNRGRKGDTAKTGNGFQRGANGQPTAFDGRKPEAVRHNGGPLVGQTGEFSAVAFEPAPAPSEEDQIRSELAQIAFITDYDFKNAAFYSKLDPFGNFPHLDLIENALLRSLPQAQQDAYNKYMPPLLPQAGATNIISGSFGSWQTDIIYGIADWAIASARQQLLETAVNDWYKKLKADELTRTLLSNTLGTFEQFLTDGSLDLAKYGALWKAAFQKDLENIPVHLEGEPFVTTLLQRLRLHNNYVCEFAPFIAGSTSFVYGIRQKKNPAIILNDLATQYVAAADNTNFPVFKRIVILANILAETFGQVQGNIYTPMSISTLKSMDTMHWQALLREVYMTGKTELDYALGGYAPALVNESNAGINTKFFGLVNSLLTAYQSYLTITSSVTNTNTGNPSTNSLSSADVGNMVDVSLDVIKHTAGFVLARNPSGEPLVNLLFTRYGDSVFAQVAEIGKGLATKEYGMVLNGSTALLQSACSIVKLDDSARNQPANTQVLTAISKLAVFGSFMTNILTAKSAEDVQNALAEIIPKDQYKLKNTYHTVSVSLSTYPGLFFGGESIKKYNVAGGVADQTTSYKSRSLSASLYMPIGVDIALGCGPSSVGLFFQAFDLGAVLNYRLNNNDSTVQASPNISWQQLVSPGVSFFYQIDKTPIVIAAGVNYTPGLRKIQQGGVSYDANALRYGISLTVDVTAFHLRL